MYFVQLRKTTYAGIQHRMKLPVLRQKDNHLHHRLHLPVALPVTALSGFPQGSHLRPVPYTCPARVPRVSRPVYRQSL